MGLRFPSERGGSSAPSRFERASAAARPTINERGAENGLDVAQQRADALGARLPETSLNFVAQAP